MITYSPCDGDVTNRARKLINQHYEPIKTHEVKIGYVYADAGDSDAPAVMLHGRACYAKVRRTTHRERVQGMPDAEIIIDKKRWEDLSDETKNAILDHELYHIEVDAERDGSGRPKIYLKDHDWEITGFAEIVSRHGEHSIEFMEARSLHERYGQLLFDFEAAGA